MIDRDPWDPPAELVDPFATPRERLKTADMRRDINGRIALSSQNDPALCPQLVQKTLAELTLAADGADPAQDALPASVWARWLLEQLHHRAVTGVEWDEPQEPAWSLDSRSACSHPRSNHGDGRGCDDEHCPRHGGEPAEPLYRHVLSDGDGDLG